MKRLLEKLKSLPTKYYLIAVPLLCGIIIGTITTLSIPKIKADTQMMNNNTTPASNVTVNAPAPTTPATQIVNQSSPTSVPTTPPNQPTSVPAQQSNTTTGQQNPTVVPCR